MSPPSGARQSTLAISALCVAIFVIAAVAVSRQTSLWLDETTQLSGLALGPVDVLRWLTAPRAHELGVPGDRTPPLSYWLGQAWAALFGLNQLSMRRFGITSVAVACAFVVATGRHLGGLGAAIAAGLLFATSPNVLQTAVQIRAYPLLLLWSAGAFYFLVRLTQETNDNRRRAFDLWALTICLVAAIFTHLYGLILAAGILTSCIVRDLAAGRRLRASLTAALTTVLAALGLVPFIIGAVEIAGAGPQGLSLREVARLFYRPFLHPAMPPTVAMIGILGAAVTLLAAAKRSRHDARSAALFLAIAVGVAAVLIAGFVQHTFPAFTASYNVWMLPGLFALAAASIGVRGRDRRWATTGFACLLIANLAGSYELVRHGRFFSAGRFNELAPLLACRGRQPRAVVYEGEQFGFVYFPVRYTLAPQPEHFVQVADEGLIARWPGDDAPAPITVLDAACVAVINIRGLTGAEVRRAIAGENLTPPRGRIAEILASEPDWQLVDELQLPSLIAVHATIFLRRPAAAGR